MGRFRPVNAIITPDHPLWNGCQAAYLGQLPGSTHYHDSSVRGNDGTLIAGTWSAALGRRVVEMNGTSSYGKLTNVKHGIGGGDFTLSAWIKPTAASAYRAVISFGAYNPAFYCRTSSSTNMYLYGYGASAVSSTLQTVAGVWQFVAVRVKAGQVSMFRNTDSDIDIAARSETITETTIGIGTSRATSTPIEFFEGAIADPTIWNRALSLSEIGIQANRADPMLGGALWTPSNRLTMLMSGGTPPVASNIPVIMHHRRMQGAA